MSATHIKTELRELIEQQEDLNLLKAIRTLLKKAGLDAELKEKLTARALKSEEDIEKGRLFTREEIVKATGKRK